jgi:hypothetical protein
MLFDYLGAIVTGALLTAIHPELDRTAACAGVPLLRGFSYG